MAPHPPTRTEPQPRPLASSLLLSPLAVPATFVAVLTATIVSLHVLVALRGRGAAVVRLVPELAFVHDVAVYLSIASLLLVAYLVRRRVAPLWSGVGTRWKAVYLAGVLGLHACVVAAASLVIYVASTDLDVFMPSRLVRTAVAHDGRRAYVYGGGGLGTCSYDVWIAGRHRPTMTRVLSVPQVGALPRAPDVQWAADGTVRLVDADGRALVPSHQRFATGC